MKKVKEGKCDVRPVSGRVHMHLQISIGGTSFFYTSDSKASKTPFPLLNI